MHIRSRIGAGILLVLLALPGVTLAQWSDDPAQNLAVADRANSQTVPEIAATSDGGVYIGWFDNAAGQFELYLQRLDASGNEQWPHNGLLISDHPQNSALFGWDMIVDSNDNAILVFSDERDGGDLDIHAYKVTPAGAFAWGPDGVTLSFNTDFEPAPRVAEATDGDLVFVWGRDETGADGDIRMQRLSPGGAPRFAAGGIPVAAAAGEEPGFAEIVAGDGGSVILSWVRDIKTFFSNRHVRAEKFSANGTSMWGAPVEVFDAFSIPIGYFPGIVSDASGGAVIVWHRSDGSFFNAFVQHLDALGTETYAHNGAAVSTAPNMHHINPSFSYDPASGETIVFYNEKISNQSQTGLYAQKISASGTRMWGAGGVMLLPVDAVPRSFPRSVGVAGGAMAFLVDTPTTDRLIGIRVDGSGSPVWPGSTVVLSSSSGSKSRFPVTTGGGGARLVWEDTRGGDTDLYAQNVNPDGSLGAPSGLGRILDPIVVDKSPLVPGDLTLRWTPSCSAGATDYAIYEGTLGSFYSHQPLDCSDDGANLKEEITPGSGATYYLVVPHDGTSEGSHGVDSTGSERPRPGTVCASTLSIGVCP